MRKPSTTGGSVSVNNPCPFLRALVAQGRLPDDKAPIGVVTKTIVDVAKTGDGVPDLPGAAIRAIALLTQEALQVLFALEQALQLAHRRGQRCPGR